MLDLWEHSFYLQYENVAGDYVKAWCNIVDWANVQKRFSGASARPSVASGEPSPPSFASSAVG